MAYEPTLNTFPTPSGAVVLGHQDHHGKLPSALRKNSIVALVTDDLMHYDWDAAEGKESYAVLARNTSGDRLVAFRSDEKATRDAWLRSNVGLWLGYLT